MFTYSRFIELLLKGHGHKYIKRIPYNTPKGRRYRYIYNVTHSHQGKHVMDESHLVVGTKFMVHTESGKEIHAHIKSVNGNKVTYVLDDGPNKGKEVTKTRSEIVSMLNDTHGVDDKVNAKREQLRTQIEQARKTGTEKQVARLEERLKRLGGEPAKQEEPTETKKTSISAQDFDDLKTGDRIKIKHRDSLSGEKEFEYEVGRKSVSKKYNLETKRLYRVTDGKAKKTGVAPIVLRKRDNDRVIMAHSDMALQVTEYTPPQKPKTPTKKKLGKQLVPDLLDSLTDIVNASTSDNEFRVGNALRDQINTTSDSVLNEKLTKLRRRFIDAIKQKREQGARFDKRSEHRAVIREIAELLELKPLLSLLEADSSTTQVSKEKPSPHKKAIKTALRTLKTSKTSNVLKNGRRTRKSTQVDRLLIDQVSTLLKEAFEGMSRPLPTDINERTKLQNTFAQLRGALNTFKSAQNLITGSWTDDHESLKQKRDDSRADIYSALRNLDLHI